MKRLLSVCLSLCIMMSVFVSFDITASAKTNLKKTTVSASNTASGVNVSWKKVSGAKSYKVYRKASGAKKYSVVKKTNNKTVKYLDKKVSAGKTYSYQVVAVKGKETSKSKTKSITRLLAPQNVKVQSYVKNTDCTVDPSSGSGVVNFTDNLMGIKITWSKSQYANKYDIYRKTNKGKFKKIDTVGNKSTYVDEDVYNVNTYYYRVLARKNTSTSAISDTKKINYVSYTDIAATPLAGGMAIGWSIVYGCDGYKIYRSPNGKADTYSLVNTVEKNKIKWVDKNVHLGKTYYYKIVVYKGSLNSVGMTVKAKYKADETINVKVGKTNDYIKKEAQKVVKESEGDITMKDLISMVKITPLNTKVAKVSSDFVITGASKGSTKAKVILTYFGMSEEAGFILINVN